MNSSVPPSVQEMFQRELETVGVRPQHARSAVQRSAPGSSSAYWLSDPPCDLSGLALSGGGIRSATFNLGLLQGMAEIGLLQHFHFLSTVSGGGYIGGFWSAWRQRYGNSSAAFPMDKGGAAETPSIRHLREFSNFLSPRMGLFNMETGNLASALFSSLVPSLAAALSVILLLLYGWTFLTWLLFQHNFTTSIGLLLFVTLGIQLVFEGAWHVCSEAEDKAFWTFAVSILLGLGVTGGLWWWLWPEGVWLGQLPLRLLGILHRPGYPSFLPLFSSSLGSSLLTPAVATAGGALFLTLIRWTCSRWFTGFESRCRRGAIDRVISRLLLAALAWMLLSLLWSLGVLLIARYSGWGSVSVFGVSLASGGLFSWARKLLGEQPSKPLVGGVRERLKPLLPQLLAYLTLTLLLVGCVALIVYSASHWNASLPVRLGPLGFALGVILLTLVFFDPTEMGFHTFYRSRLARAYLGASNLDYRASANRTSADCKGDDLLMKQLPRSRPLHLICCTANDLAGDHLANLSRGARSAVLSREGFSVGEDWRPWEEGPEVSLASAMTASGAAFNSHMGSKSMLWGLAVTFLMTALNLRLGLWLPHPRHWTKERRRPFLFFSELLSLSKAGGQGSSAVPGTGHEIARCAWGKSVHISDGGHFENLGIYELIRRHCRYIVVSDCGADPDVAFDDLGNAVRRVREDFGVEIQIDLRPLRPGPDGTAIQPMVSGDIVYPEGDRGILLYFKPTLIGNEPADILQYKRRNAAFPHETTGDQFYDEAQWESYRRLGLHAAKSAFRFLGSTTGSCSVDVFSRARFEWSPIPEAAREHLPRLMERVPKLEAMLRGENCSRLMREVYKEIDELDRDRPPGTSCELSPDELASSLQALRLAILFMEEVFFSIDLEANASHPVYQGWLNYFARWAYAPLFRMWWPLLKPMYHSHFTRFLERVFFLPHVQSSPSFEKATGTAEPMPAGFRGFAWKCWERSFKGRRQMENQICDKVAWHYRLAMHYEGREKPYDVQAALVFLHQQKGAVIWDEQDFFVPPGLWESELGEDFLDKLSKALGAERLIVRFPRVPAAGPSRGRADKPQLYRCAGFHKAWQDGNRLIDSLTGEDLRVDISGYAQDSTWLFRTESAAKLPAEDRLGLCGMSCLSLLHLLLQWADESLERKP